MAKSNKYTAIKLHPRILTAYKNTHRQFSRLLDTTPGAFRIIKAPKEVRIECELQWPKQHYSGVVRWEGWDLWELLQSAMFIGYEMARDPNEYRNKKKQLKNLRTQLERYHFSVKGREFHGVYCKSITEHTNSDGTKSISYMHRYHKNKFTVANPAITIREFIAAHDKWQQRMLRRINVKN